MKIVFCIYNYVRNKLPLQPWLTIDVIANHLVEDGHDVHIVTDANDPSITEVNVHVVRSLRGSNSAEIQTVIDSLSPDVIVTLVTPLNLATGGWIKRYANIPVIAFSSYPFYNFLELIRAVPHVSPKELLSYVRHLVVPGFLWKRNLYTGYRCIICQSGSGRARLQKLLGDNIPVLSIPPGIDLDTWNTRNSERTPGKSLRLLYLGTASSIRGFDVCIQAFRQLSNLDIKLTILARGASDEQAAEISTRLQLLDIKEKTELIGGWIDRGDMIAYIKNADLVVLPFVLVPSELPVSVMEVIACGTPVLTTDIDGLPSTVGTAGIIVRQGSVRSLVQAITGLYHNREELLRLRENCKNMTSNMYGWSSMYQKWLKEILGKDG